MMERKKKVYSVLCVLALAGIAAVLLCAWAMGAGRTYTLHLPEAAQLSRIQLTRGEEKTVLDSADACEAFLTLLAGAPRQTREESVQDFPVGAQQVIQVGLYFTQEGASTFFLYEKRGKYFLEQPYNGIYPLSADEWAQVLAYAGWE